MGGQDQEGLNHYKISKRHCMEIFQEGSFMVAIKEKRGCKDEKVLLAGLICLLVFTVFGCGESSEKVSDLKENGTEIASSIIL